MNRRHVIPALLIAATLASALPGGGPAGASEPYTWDLPQRIPDYYDMLRAPVLVADKNRTVYAFDLERGETQDFALMYRTWTMTAGWSAPIDILLPPFLGIAPLLLDAFLSEDGTMHLIYFGGTQTEGFIFYTQAVASQAGSAQAWSEPLPVAPNAGPVASGVIGRIGDDGLLIAYAGERQGQGLYATVSLDLGNTWSEATALARASLSDQYFGSIWLDTDESGKAHLVWDSVDSSGQGIDLGYVRLESDGEGRSQPTILARRDTDLEAVGAPSLAVRGGSLYLVYQDGYPPTRWMRVSHDAGETWEPPVRPFPHVGGYGAAVLLKDSAGQIHMILGNRLPRPEIHGMWYSRLENEQWLPLEPIISGPAAPGFDPCCPEAVISQGNVLLATWPHNVRQELLTGAWYSYALLDAPELAVVPLPAAVLPAGASALAGTDAPAQGAATAAAPPSAAGFSTARRSSGSPAWPIFAGSAPVVILLLVLAYDRRVRRSVPASRRDPANEGSGAGGRRT